MRMICPYCGTKQAAKNPKCQFCGAVLPAEAPTPASEEAPRAETAAAPTALCTICMNSVVISQLTEYEGKGICPNCLKKLKRQESALAPVMKKAAAAAGEKAAPRPARRYVQVLSIGLIVGLGGVASALVGYRSSAAAKAQTLNAAATKLEPVLERCNQALVILIQEAPEEKLLAEANTLLEEAVEQLGAEGLREVSGSFPSFERFRSRLEALERQRLRCARTLCGKPLEGDPATTAEARELLAQTRDDAAIILSELVRDLRLYGLSIKGLVFY